MILLISPKNKYTTNRLVEEAGKAGKGVVTLSAQELAERNFKIDVAAYSALYVRFPYPYFNEITELARKFRDAGKRVVDACIAEGDIDHNKMEAYQRLGAAGLPTPKTTWLLENQDMDFPYIVKWIYGFKGREVFLVRSEQDLVRVMNLLPPEELLAQEYIEARYEYKVITAGYKSLPVVLRFGVNPQTHRVDFANVTMLSTTPSRQGRDTPPILGGEWDQSPPSIGGVSAAGGRGGIKEAVSLAEQASKVLGRELAKVDILEANGQFYILEVNRSPGLKTLESFTGRNIAADYISYIESPALVHANKSTATTFYAS